MSVFKKMATVQAVLAKRGIGKDQTNTFDKYQFRGIDDVYNSLAAVLAESGLVIYPSVQEYTVEQFSTAKGGINHMCRATVDYIFADADGGETITVRVVGEGTDRGDKAMNKAMSAAYKLMAFQTFCIPVEGGSVDSEQDSEQLSVKLVGSYEMTTMRESMQRQNMEESKFLEWQGLESLDQMPLDRFAGVMGQLNRREQKLAQEYAEGEAQSARATEAEVQ